MFGESLDLSEVLNTLKRADDALSEFIAPLWPGVRHIAAWMEHGPQLFLLDDAPSLQGYYLLACDGSQAKLVKQASENDAQRYRNYLERANVTLLEHGFAYPVSFAERLQGITAPRPIFFAPAQPLLQVVARYDGINLFYDRTPDTVSENPLGDLFSGNAIFTTGELLGVPGEEHATDRAQEANDALSGNADLQYEYRLKSLLEPAGATLMEWSRRDRGVQLSWRLREEEHTTRLLAPDSPISSGICLPGARHFDVGALTRLMLEHALDTWR